MNCSKCGTPISAGERFCSVCGTPCPVTPAPPSSDDLFYVPDQVYVPPVSPDPEPVYAPPVQQEPVYAPPVQQEPMYAVPPVYEQPVPQYTPMPPRSAVVTEQELPPQYRPLSAWSYWGLKILYAVPIVGLIFLIVFSFKSDNINRRSFTRSYWCNYVIIGGLLLLTLGIIAAIDISILEDLIDSIDRIF